MKVLGVCDGISVGQIALSNLNVDVDKYYASEIHSPAIKVTQKNFPNTIQLGDVRNILSIPDKIDLLLGGTPCQDLSQYKSSTGNRTGLQGEKSSLFFEYVRLLNTLKPKYFLLENVVMNQEDERIITEALGVEPIKINSSLVCAAERKRLYWTNIKGVTQPEDLNVLIKDIILPADSVEEKYWYRDVDFTYNGDDCKVQATLNKKLQRSMKEVYNINGKCNTLTCDGDGGHRQKKVFQNGTPRKFTPLEYERLQTLPDNYTQGISDSNRYSVIGNGWTEKVIRHILSFMDI